MPHPSFDLRLILLEEKHRLLADGATYRVGADGLITAQPICGVIARAPTRGLLLLLVGVFVFKASLFVMAGEGVYEARRAELASGSIVEQAAAWIMQSDPITQALAAVMSGLF